MILLPSARGVLAAGSVDPFFANVVMLLHMDGTNNSTTFTNSASGGSTFVAHGNAKIVTSSPTPLFGTGCMSCAGGGSDYIDSTSVGYTLGTGDFTLEWAMYTATPTQDRYVMGMDGTVTWNVASGASNSRPYWEGGGTAQVTAAVGDTQPTSTWCRWAFVRASGTYYCFKNGVLSASASPASKNYNGTGIRLGTSPGGFPWAGFLDEVRLTKGVARYTSTYTLATDPFPNQ